MARNYQQAKIYCIKVNTEEEYLPYVGSSCKRLLSQRMNQHRDDYKKWKNNPEKYSFVSSFTLFEKYGIENCYIELIELFPCNCNDELRKKEREHIKKMKCVNIIKNPIRTIEEKVEYHKEYRDEHKEEITEYMKEWYDKHKEQVAKIGKIYRVKHKEEITGKKKIYYDKHKEEIAEKNKEYHQKNKEQISEQKKETYECPCGSVCRKSDKARHEKSKKHQEYLSTIGTLCSIAITESP